MINSNKQLINHLKKEGVLKASRIVNAFRFVDRADFVKQERSRAYLDRPLPIGEGQTISQPFTVAFMLEKLKSQPGEKIMDVGSGSGWTTALLSYCANLPINKDSEVDGDNLEKKETAPQPQGKVVGVELREKLCQFGFKNASRYFPAQNYCRNQEDLSSKEFSEGKILFVQGDGSRGFPALAPFDRILVSASTPQIFKSWKKQLKVGGTLVVPKSGSLWRLIKEGEEKFTKEEYPGFRFVDLKTSG